jgi:hypothetical protein
MNVCPLHRVPGLRAESQGFCWAVVEPISFRPASGEGKAGQKSGKGITESAFHKAWCKRERQRAALVASHTTSGEWPFDAWSRREFPDLWP